MDALETVYSAVRFKRMFSRLFWKLFTAHAILYIVVMVGMAWTITHAQENHLRELAFRRLRDTAMVLRSVALLEIDTVPAEDLRRMVVELGESTQLRLSLIASDGEVLADSSRPSAQVVGTLENLRDRPELKQANVALNGQAVSTRFSRTLGMDMHYFAIRLEAGGEHVGWVRAGFPVDQLRRRLNAMRRRVWSASALAALGLLLATSGLVLRTLRPLAYLTRAADAIAAGNYRDPVYLGTNDEWGQLAETLNRMRQERDVHVAQLRETNLRLSTVLGGMTDGVIALDKDQKILFANRAAGELIGFSPDAAQGKRLLEMVRSHLLHEMVVSLLQRPGQQQIELAWGEGGRRSLLVSATSQPDASSAGIVMVINNLTEIRRLEAMRRDFVANVSHELKTPLSSIKAYAETLSQGAIEDEKHRRHFVRQIEDQADRLHQLIADLLSLARIEAGKHHLESVSVARVVELCVHEQQRAAKAKRIKLGTSRGSDVYVEADADGLRQILINLIDNAIKYTPEQGEVTVGWRDEGGQVALFVQDTGIGIPSDLQNRVFERFFRVDKARSSEMGGTGLGLAIVKHLAQSFGGSVEVRSRLEQGSRFTVKLPVARDLSA